MTEIMYLSVLKPDKKIWKILLDIIITTSDGLRNPSPCWWYSVVLLLCPQEIESPCTDKSSFVKAFNIDAQLHNRATQPKGYLSIAVLIQARTAPIYA